MLYSRKRLQYAWSRLRRQGWSGAVLVPPEKADLKTASTSKLFYLTHDVMRYKIQIMIASFKSKAAEQVFRRQACRKLPLDMQPLAHRKLAQLDSADGLSDLQKLPGNRLDALPGDRKGLYCILINDQYWIGFVWRDNSAYEVEIMDQALPWGGKP